MTSLELNRSTKQAVFKGLTPESIGAISQGQLDQVDVFVNDLAPFNFFHVWGTGKIASGSPWIYGNGSAHFMNRYAEQNSNPNNYFEFKVPLRRARYLFQLYAFRGTARPILEVQLNYAPMRQIDLYQNPVATVPIPETWEAEVEYTGLHTFGFLNLNKNPASSGYAVRASAFFGNQITF